MKNGDLGIAVFSTHQSASKNIMRDNVPNFYSAITVNLHFNLKYKNTM